MKLVCSAFLVSPVLLLCGALSAQTVSTPSSTLDATNPPRLVSTPEVALPGSGTPASSGIVDVNANNPTNNPAAVVFTPGSTGPAAATEIGEQGNVMVTGASGSGSASSNSQMSAAPPLLNTGITNFESGANGVPAAQRPMSLGDVARYYRAQKQANAGANATSTSNTPSSGTAQPSSQQPQTQQQNPQMPQR